MMHRERVGQKEKEKSRQKTREDKGTITSTKIEKMRQAAKGISVVWRNRERPGRRDAIARQYLKNHPKKKNTRKERSNMSSAFMQAIMKTDEGYREISKGKEGREEGGGQKGGGGKKRAEEQSLSDTDKTHDSQEKKQRGFPRERTCFPWVAEKGKEGCKTEAQSPSETLKRLREKKKSLKWEQSDPKDPRRKKSTR